MRTPHTIPECDALLTRTHQRYLRAMGRLSHVQQEDDDAAEAADAAELWIQLHELLDLRLHLPQQRS